MITIGAIGVVTILTGYDMGVDPYTTPPPVIVITDFEAAIRRPFQNNTEIIWDIDSVTTTKKIGVYNNLDVPVVISFIFTSLPDGVTISCPLNNTVIEPKSSAENSMTLTLPQEAGQVPEDGARLPTRMYYIWKET